ncbi:MAG TPA: DUF3168 domain-containing protein [Arenicellales bacterium]|nr:DUF3168 domain-containing protein [Arenicellales bacterium]
MIEVAIRAALLAAPSVSALVGPRVWPIVLPDAPEYPAITYQIVTGGSEYSMQGTSRLANPRVQVDLYAETHMDLLQLKGAVMATLSGLRGIVGSPPVRIHGVFREMEQDFYEQQLERSGPTVWRKSLDFTVWFKEQYDG